jgi:Rrf2 family protein
MRGSSLRRKIPSIFCMWLTLHTNNALRTLIYLGLRQDHLVSIREIAEAQRISENHLVKVVHNLGRGGFIETTTIRGRRSSLGASAGGDPGG